MLKVVIRKNERLVLSTTVVNQRVLYTKFEETVTFTSQDRMTIDIVADGSDDVPDSEQHDLDSSKKHFEQARRERHEDQLSRTRSRIVKPNFPPAM